MNNTFYFLRHAETSPDKERPVSTWVLSRKGEEQARQVAESGAFDEMDIIITSAEEKAFQTAKPLATKLRKEITRYHELNEIHRDKGGYLELEEFEEAVKFGLGDIYASEHHWETAHEALERFSRKVEEIEDAHDDKKILIVAHGMVINLYFAKILDKLDHVYERLQENSFCDWGVIHNNKVEKDIVKE